MKGAPSAPPTRDCQLRYNVQPPPYADLMEKFECLANWYFCNERRKVAGYQEDSIARLASIMQVEPDELTKLINSPEFIEYFSIKNRKNSIMRMTILEPLADEVIKQLLKSDDPSDRKKGLELYQKRQDTMGEVDIRKDVQVKTNPDKLIKDIAELFLKVEEYSWGNGERCSCNARRNFVRLLQGIREEGPHYLENAVETDVVQDVGEVNRNMGFRPQRPDSTLHST